MIKGEIWRARLGPPRGSQPAFTRPVLVIQGDAFNKSTLNTVICAAITSNVRLAKAVPNILIEMGVSKLPETSVINFSQIVAVDREFFVEQISMLSKQFLEKIDESLKIIFDIRS
jgi:mRNA interferase MazF